MKTNSLSSHDTKKKLKPELPLLFYVMPELILRKESLISKYVYPAIFTPEQDGGYSVYFPDLEGCCCCNEY